MLLPNPGTLTLGPTTTFASFTLVDYLPVTVVALVIVALAVALVVSVRRRNDLD